MKTSYFIRNLILIFTILISSMSQASHVVGSDINYVKTGNTYTFTLTIYRDCRGIPLNNQYIYVQNGNTSKAIQVTLKSIEDITPVCDTFVNAPCNPANTSGTSAGVEKHVYISLPLSVDSSAYTYLKNGTHFTVKWSQCCRNGAINTGSQGNFYTEASVYNNVVGDNNSPFFYEMPFTKLHVNRAFRRNFGGFDIDGDSLSFELEDPLTNAGITTQYNSPYSKFKPLTVFEPTGVTSPNPNLNPPVGFHLNNQTGALTFTPVTQSEVTVISLVVSEFRKGILIGKIRREMQFWIDILDNNIAHTVSAPEDFCVLAGDTLNFSVLCSDAADTVFGGSVDSLFLTWDNAFVGPSFSVTSGLYESGTIHWDPSSNDARDEPYMLTFRATDNSCPYNLAVQKTVRIKVVDRIYVAPKARFSWSQKGDTSIFSNTTDVALSDIDSVQWLINGTVVSNLHNFNSVLTLDTTHDIELRMYYDIKSDCGSLFVGGDTSSATIMPKSCKASYVISLDTDTTNPYRIFLVNNSIGSGLSTKWTFSDGDSVLGTGIHNFTKFGKYEVCLEVSNLNCSDVYCDSVGMDSSGNLYKREGFTVVLLDENEVNAVPEIMSEDVYKIFPNPVSDKVSVYTLEGKRINRMELMDSKGQIILEVPDTNDLQITLHLGTLRGGIYFLRVFSEQNVTTKRLYKL